MDGSGGQGRADAGWLTKSLGLRRPVRLCALRRPPGGERDTGRDPLRRPPASKRLAGQRCAPRPPLRRTEPHADWVPPVSSHLFCSAVSRPCWLLSVTTTTNPQTGERKWPCPITSTRPSPSAPPLPSAKRCAAFRGLIDQGHLRATQSDVIHEALLAYAQTFRPATAPTTTAD